MESNNKKSIYKYAAEAGIPIGLLLTAMSACMLMGLHHPALTSLLLPLALTFPVLLWFLLRQISKKEPDYAKVSALWLGGIYSVIFGSIICMLFSAAYIVFAEPGFVYEYVTMAISSIENSPLRGEYAATTALMREAIEARILPSGMEFVATMGWTTCFSGSMLSLLIAVIIVNSKKRNGISCA